MPSIGKRASILTEGRNLRWDIMMSQDDELYCGSALEVYLYHTTLEESFNVSVVFIS